MRKSDYYPKYGSVLRTPQNSDVRFASRDIYADVPPGVYTFLSELIQEGDVGNTYMVEEAWVEYLNHHEELRSRVTHNGKPIYHFYRENGWNWKKPGYKLSISWELLDKNIETRAREILTMLRKSEKPDLTRFYGLITSDFSEAFHRINYTKEISVQDYRDRLNKSMAGIKDSKDWRKVFELIDQCVGLSVWLEKIFKTTSFLSEASSFVNNAESLNVTGIFLGMRRFIERLGLAMLSFLLCSENKGDSSSLPDYFECYVVSRLNQGEGSKSSCNANKLSKFIGEFSQKILDEGIISRNGRLNIDRFNTFIEDGHNLPSIPINTDSINSMSGRIVKKGQQDLMKLYKITSSALHTPLSSQFTTIVEIKFLKNILSWFVTTVRDVVSKISYGESQSKNSYTPFGEAPNRRLQKVVSFYEKSGEIVDALLNEFIFLEEEKYLKDATRSLLTIIDPGVARLKNGAFTYSDFKRVVNRLRDWPHKNVAINLIEGKLSFIGESVREYSDYFPDYEDLRGFNDGEVGLVLAYMWFRRPLK